MNSKKTSAVWLHFEEHEGTDTAKCNLCRKPFVYRGGCTSNLRKHLKAKHAGTPHPHPATRLSGSAQIFELYLFFCNFNTVLSPPSLSLLHCR